MILAVLSIERYSSGVNSYRKAPLSPKAKYVLARFALRFQEQVCRHERGELAALLGVSRARLSDALHELVEHGLLLVHPQREGRGRPRNHYSVSPGTWQLLQSAQNSDMEAGDFHWAAIERVMTAAPATSTRRGQDQGVASLPLETRLLLCALLCHADRHGVVRKLSSIDLYRLTGLRSDALKNRLQSLVGLELIRAWIPGVTSQALFGKAKSVYYLNLQHPLFASLYPLAGIVIYGMLDRFEEAVAVLDDLSSGKAGLKYKLSIGRKYGGPCMQAQDLLPDLEPREAVASIGEQLESKRIVPALQARLECYASWLLSRYWCEITDQAFPCPGALAEIIRHDFVEVREKQRSEVARVADTLVGYIYARAHRLARDTRRHLLQMTESGSRPQIAYQEHEYLILPHDPSPKRQKGRLGSQWTRTVLMFSKNEFIAHGCYVASKWYEQESDIPLEQRYFTGLLTKPRPLESGTTSP